jgi:hypothetical protein
MQRPVLFAALVQLASIRSEYSRLIENSMLLKLTLSIPEFIFDEGAGWSQNSVNPSNESCRSPTALHSRVVFMVVKAETRVICML